MLAPMPHILDIGRGLTTSPGLMTWVRRGLGGDVEAAGSALGAD